MFCVDQRNQPVLKIVRRIVSVQTEAAKAVTPLSPKAQSFYPNSLEEIHLMIYQKRSHIRSLEDTKVQCLERGKMAKTKYVVHS